jgi:FtsP/CotA-like multicopper oxidase with cupredoxin domain/Cu/Ag efflux protein CusF
LGLLVVGMIPDSPVGTAFAAEGHAHRAGSGPHLHGGPARAPDDAVAPYPVRSERPVVRAYRPHAHLTIADACETPGPLHRVTIEAGRQFARPGEVFGFNPRVVKVEPCAEVEVTYRNTDDVRHTFMLPGLNLMPNVEINGKGTRTLRFVAPANDISLAYHCHVAQHEKMGMAGWLIVGKGGLPKHGDPVEGAADVDVTPADSKVHEVEAEIVAVDRRQSMIVADHQEIPSVMAAMTMGFKAERAELLNGLEAGDRVRLSLRVTDMTVTGIARLSSALEVVKSEDTDASSSQPAVDTVVVDADVVAKLRSRNELLVDHEDIPGFMPAMTMAFKLRDPALMDLVTEGDRLRFEIDPVAGEIVGLAEPFPGTSPQTALTPPNPTAVSEMSAGMSSDAVTLGADLDGDGDPDEIDIRLEVIELEQEVWPGKFLNTWVFAPAGSGMAQIARLPSPVIRVEQGDRVRVHLENTHYLPHTIHPHGTIHGNAVDGVPMFTQAPVMPGEVFVTEFTAINPGSHFYHCHVQPDVHVPMGLAGMLVIEENRPDNHFSHLVVGAGAMPDMSKATAEIYDREYVLIYGDADDRMNRIPLEAADAGTIDRRLHREFDTTRYEPNIFLLNGRSFPFTLRDTPIRVKEGERVKLRILNAGSRVISLHPHGHRVRVTHKDGFPVPESGEVVRDVLTITAAQRLDVELIAQPDTVYSSGPGVWLMHDHTEHAATNNGYSPGGDITAIVYEDSHWDAASGLPRTAEPLDRYFDTAYYTGDLPTFSGDIFAQAKVQVADLGSVREGVGYVIATSAADGTVSIDRDPTNGLLAGVGTYVFWDESLLELAEIGARVNFTLDLDTGEILLIEPIR